ncbi:RNA polymerase sigma factor [Daejeonella lutea]|uniref:RNA polymerase sigma-70 factor, ECF subfamily n=1 Tax=Daejeonella lutea TaxID=572036 RepID=A0A1T5A576_9SPHI|nr:RNA polymerase sigma factor [Daejeonella lutea]SKB30124.1 RNA polymerase sigma-70 factor, ECF subfamily [Daejeonella lutea]
MIKQESEIKLILEGCRANDRRAQEVLYRLLYKFAMSTAMRYSRDELDAGDILSHAFVRIFKHIHTFDENKGTIYSWVKRIIINESLDHIKARIKFADNLEIEAVAEPAINNAALDRLNASEIMTMIQKLPPATHAVFVLYAVEGYKHKEISETLGISEGTSKWHLSEARKALQQKIESLNTV